MKQKSLKKKVFKPNLTPKVSLQETFFTLNWEKNHTFEQFRKPKTFL